MNWRYMSLSAASKTATEALTGSNAASESTASIAGVTGAITEDPTATRECGRLGRRERTTNAARAATEKMATPTIPPTNTGSPKNADREGGSSLDAEAAPPLATVMPAVEEVPPSPTDRVCSVPLETCVLFTQDLHAADEANTIWSSKHAVPGATGMVGYVWPPLGQKV